MEVTFIPESRDIMRLRSFRLRTSQVVHPSEHTLRSQVIPLMPQFDSALRGWRRAFLRAFKSRPSYLPGVLAG